MINLEPWSTALVGSMSKNFGLGLNFVFDFAVNENNKDMKVLDDSVSDGFVVILHL